MTTICLINQKGGCGKSSCCFHLAGAFAQLGRRVLLVDADPQGSLSQGFFGSSRVECLEPSETITAAFRDDLFVTVDDLAVPTADQRIAIIRANQHLSVHNVPCPELLGMRQFALQSLLAGVSGYDLVLIDCPPNLYGCTWNALLAADFVLVPVPPEDFGTQGLRTVHQGVENASELNPRLTLLGHLVTRHDQRLLIHRAYEQKLRTLYGASVLDTIVPEASAYKVSLACRQPVTHYSPRSRAAHAVRSLANEIVERSHRTAQCFKVA